MSSDRFASMWDAHASSYDAQIAWLERRLLGDSRPWVCGRASGRVLELGIGTGLNVRHYPAGVTLTGVDWSSAMLQKASDAAARLGVHLDTKQADACALPFADASFDTVLATYVLCSVPSLAGALGEARRVLKPGGRLLLADHVAPPNPVLRLGARLLEAVTGPAHGEFFTRRPRDLLAASGFEIVASERAHHGVIERVDAVAR